MSWRQQLDTQTIISIFMAVLALAMILPVLLMSWQSMRATFDGGCFDKRTGEVFNHVVSYVAVASDEWEKVNIDIEGRPDGYCYIPVRDGYNDSADYWNDFSIVVTTPGAGGLLDITPLRNDDIKQLRVDLYAATTPISNGEYMYYIEGDGDGRIYSEDGYSHFEWEESANLPNILPQLIITIAGLAIFISIGSILIMCLPKRNW